jgi:hypothetical protein
MLGRPVKADYVGSPIATLLRKNGLLYSDLLYKFKKNMLKTLLNLLVIGLCLFLIWFVVGLFIKGMILTIVGAILVVVFIIKALEAFDIKI